MPLNILYFVPYVPNLIRVRPYNLIRALSKRGNRVTLVTLWSTETEKADAKAMEGVCESVYAFPISKWRSLWNCLAFLPTGVPLQAVYSWQPRLASQVHSLATSRQEVRPFDIVHIEHLRGARYGLYVLNHNQARSPNGPAHPPVVWDSVDCISHLFRQAAQKSRRPLNRWITRFELSRTEKYERWLVGQFDQVLVTSPTDREAFQSLMSQEDRSAIEVLTNGVDLDYFRPDPATNRLTDTLVLSGKMSYHANISMAIHMVQEVMPLIWASRPQVELLIVGKNPPREILNLDSHPRITVTGTVPDIREYLRKATVAVSPITYGAGIQNKVLEAMACATPVVTSPRVVSSLSAKVDETLLVAEDPDEFSASVLQLLENPRLRHRIGQNGRRYIEEHHNWSGIASQLEGTYHEVIATRSARN